MLRFLPENKLVLLFVLLTGGGMALAGAADIPQSRSAMPLSPVGHGTQATLPQSYQRSRHLYPVPEAQLITSEGEQVLLAEQLDSEQPVILNFIFTSCGTICPVQTATFSQVQKSLISEGETVRLISISIDPERDTPQRLKQYSGDFRAQPGWFFLTGGRDQIDAVQRAFNAYRGDKMSHVPLTFIRGEDQIFWLRLEGFISTTDILDEYHALQSQ